MEFSNEFEVEAPIEQVWSTLLDVERVAPCVPGAQVTERVSDDAYKVAIKIRVGPMTVQYRGDVEIVETDPERHRAVMSAKAREARGQGTANAQVTMDLSGDGSRTHGKISTDVQLTGKVAAMGQGVIQDVSARIVDQFSENLAAMLQGGGEEPAAPEPGGRDGEPKPAGAAPGAPKAPPAPPHEAPRPAKPGGDEGLDVVPLVAGMAADRMKDPRVLGATLGIVFLLGVLFGRRGR